MPIPDRLGNNEASLGVSARDICVHTRLWHWRALEVRQKKLKTLGDGAANDIVETTDTCMCTVQYSGVLRQGRHGQVKLVRTVLSGRSCSVEDRTPHCTQGRE